MLYFFAGIIAGLTFFYLLTNLKKKTSDRRVRIKSIGKTIIEPQSMDIDSLNTLLEQETKNLVLLDVRTLQEFKRGHLKGAINLSISTPQIFRLRIGKLSKDNSYVIYSQTMDRSISAANIMMKKGFSRIYQLTGGILAWKMNDYPIEK